MAKPKIFVSHSTKDNKFATKLVNDLIATGADAWMDVNDLGAGNFQRGIDEALDTCEWFILVLTRNALASEWVRDEVYAANRLKKLRKIKELIFIKASDLEHSELPAMWGNYNTFDATKDYSSALKKTLKELGLLQAANTPPSLPDGKTAVPEGIAQMAEAFAKASATAPARSEASQQEHDILRMVVRADQLFDRKLYLAALEQNNVAIRGIEHSMDEGMAKGLEMRFLRATFEAHWKRAWNGRVRTLEALGRLGEAKEAKRTISLGWDRFARKFVAREP